MPYTTGILITPRLRKFKQIKRARDHPKTGCVGRRLRRYGRKKKEKGKRKKGREKKKREGKRRKEKRKKKKEGEKEIKNI